VHGRRRRRFFVGLGRRETCAEVAIPKDGHAVGVQDAKGRRAVLEGEKLGSGPYVVLGENNRQHGGDHFGLDRVEIRCCGGKNPGGI
jgi:hypothetical protein